MLKTKITNYIKYIELHFQSILLFTVTVQALLKLMVFLGVKTLYTDYRTAVEIQQYKY